MTLEIFIAVLLAVVIGGIIVKYFGKKLLNILLFILLIPVFIFLILLGIVITPFEIIFTKFILTQENCQKNIVRNYDQIFYEANSKKKVKQALKRIDKYNEHLKKMEEKRREKETVKFLESVKWAL